MRRGHLVQLSLAWWRLGFARAISSVGMMPSLIDIAAIQR
jgi:hypothetical protein